MDLPHYLNQRDFATSSIYVAQYSILPTSGTTIKQCRKEPDIGVDAFFCYIRDLLEDEVNMSLVIDLFCDMVK